MKIVLQNVLKAEIVINGEIYSKINKGYLLLVSFALNDNKEIVKKMALKISKLRLFMDENGKTNLSLKDVNGEILSVSQFTLYGDVKDGNRPSFTKCAKFEDAKIFYDYFNECLKELNIQYKTGVFGEDMKISLINDGPFTLILDSHEVIK